MTRFPRINMPGSKHLYEMTCVQESTGAKGTISVEANNRAQATRIAERNGYEPHDCNMVG